MAWNIDLAKKNSLAGYLNLQNMPVTFQENNCQSYE